MSMGAPHDALALQLAVRPQIVLARHGRPALDRSQTMGFRGYRDWWRAYDEGGLAADQTPHPELVAIGEAADIIFSSTLRRAHETAEAVSAGQTIMARPELVEAPLPPPPVPGLRLRPGAWGVVARLSWWAGASGGQESRAAAEARAGVAADLLIEAALADGGRLVLACAHGWFNRMLRPVLLARGWLCVADGGDGYWRARRYVLGSR